MNKTKRPTRPRLARWLALAALLLPLFLPTAAFGAVLENEILADSTLQLAENATFGSYRSLTVTLTTRDGQSALIAEKDGVQTAVAIPATDALAIWKAVLAAGIETIGDAPAWGAPPDQSRFTVSFRTPNSAHSFTAYGVDALADPRYREIVREILHTTDARAYGKAWRK